MHHYVVQFVSDLRQVDVLFQVLRFPQPIKLPATILLKVALSTINQPHQAISPKINDFSQHILSF